MYRFSVFFIAFVVLVGCKTANDYAGSGPLQISSSTKAFVDEITNRGNSLVAVSYDGQYAYAYVCPFADGCRQVDIDPLLPISKCEERASRCAIYSNLGFIIWDGPVTIGYTSVTSPRGKTDLDVCNFAIIVDQDNARWETRQHYLDEVAEAKHRGFTPMSCRKLTNQ